MAIDKVRVRKDLQKRVEQWAAVLEISQSRLIDDAIRHYLRFLDGKPNIQQITTPLPQINPPTTATTPTTTETDEDDEEFEGDINL